MSRPTPTQRSQRAPIQFFGVLFALSTNLFLVTAAHLLVMRSGLPASAEMLATFVGPVLAGIATAFYVGQRGGIHAFWGGFISIPLLTYVVFDGLWQFGLFGGAFCGLAGALTEIVLRKRG